MSEYTPTTDQVRARYCAGWTGNMSNEYGTAFDQWLNEVRAEAWDEGHHAGQHNEHEYRPQRAMRNPYRQETDT